MTCRNSITRKSSSGERVAANPIGFGFRWTDGRAGTGAWGQVADRAFYRSCFLQIMRLEIQGFSEATYAAMATMSSIVSLATTARMRLLAAPEREPC
jgi:hypothetical protein